MIRRFLFAALVLFGLAGCASSDYSRSDFIRANQVAADALLAQLPAGNKTMLVATLVNIDALDRSSTFGRLISESISTRFSQAGNRMIEMKLRNNVYISQGQGELMLTREIQDLASNHAAQAVIVGSYGEGKSYVYVNLKVVQPHTNTVLAAHDYAIRLNDNVRSMLRVKRF